jgi:hypothetical protein
MPDRSLHVLWSRPRPAVSQAGARPRGPHLRRLRGGLPARSLTRAKGRSLAAMRSGSGPSTRRRRRAAPRALAPRMTRVRPTAAFAGRRREELPLLIRAHRRGICEDCLGLWQQHSWRRSWAPTGSARPDRERRSGIVTVRDGDSWNFVPPLSFHARGIRWNVSAGVARSLFSSCSPPRWPARSSWSRFVAPAAGGPTARTRRRPTARICARLCRPGPGSRRRARLHRRVGQGPGRPAVGGAQVALLPDLGSLDVDTRLRPARARGLGRRRPLPHRRDLAGVSTL